MLDGEKHCFNCMLLGLFLGHFTKNWAVTQFMVCLVRLFQSFLVGNIIVLRLSPILTSFGKYKMRNGPR